MLMWLRCRTSDGFVRIRRG